jgi:hypothetical protein
MLKGRISRILFLIPMVFLLRLFPCRAHGDKVIPQVFDGGGVGRTKFDLTNLSPEFPITKVSVLFFRQDGSPWPVTTNQGTGTSFNVNLGPFQTTRIETTGASPTLTVGYAIVRNTERTTQFAEDFEVAITVFFEILNGPFVVDTVSVPAGQPTVSFAFPVEMDNAVNLFTGFAVVNLTDADNNVALWLYESTTPGSSIPPPNSGMVNLTLNARQQRAQFLNEGNLFPTRTKFKGMLLGFASGPVAILALLQTGTPFGVQFATLVPAYQDALRRNTHMYLQQGLPLDADLPVSDYTGNSEDSAPWDLLYETQSLTARRLVPQSGAMFAPIGLRSDSQFDNEVTLEFLQGLTYSTNPIDMSNGSPNLAGGFAFAIQTGLKRYVKVRVSVVVSQANDRHLVLEMEVYR